MFLADYFFQLAKDRVWANQHADRHAIFELKKLTTFTGIKRWLSLPFLSTHMPDWPATVDSKTYIVYEVGGYDKDIVGIDNTLANWKSLSELIVTSRMFAIAFMGNRLFNLSKTYIRKTSDGTLIVAIEREGNRVRLKEQGPVYLRLYSNVETITDLSSVYDYQSLTLDKLNDVNPTSIYSNFLADYAALSIDNTAYVFLNGMLLADAMSSVAGMPAYASLPALSQFEIIVDPEIINFITINKSDFVEFDSTVDGVRKYIACSPEDSDNMYCDDLEFFVSGIGNSPSMRIGLYMPRLSDYYIRQLTFKDWTFSKEEWNQITDRISQQAGFTVTDFQLHVIVRNSGQQIQYIQDSNRIPDIMNLPTHIRKVCFTNTNSTIDIWKAENLESCPFNRWLGLSESQLTESAFYNVFSSYGAVRVSEGVTRDLDSTEWRLPLIVQNDGGLLLRFPTGLKEYSDTVIPNTALGGDIYASGLGNEIFIPTVDNTGNLDLQVPIGTATTSVITGFGIFCYYFNHVSLQYAVYEQDYTYSDIGGVTVIEWQPHMLEFTRYVRTANKFVYWKGIVNTVDIDTGIDVYNGRAKINDIGLGKLMVWYKGRYLIEELDYVVQFGKIHLCSKWEWQTEVGGNVFEVLYWGLPNPLLTHTSNDEYGFLARGKISYDNRYDLYTNRHRMIVAAGRVITPDEIFSSEAYEEINNGSLDTEIYKDGLPWSVVNLPSLLRSEEIEIYSTPALHDSIVDMQIETFLSSIYPQATNESPILISSKYDLFSPFLNKIIQDIQDSFISITTTSMTDEQIDAVVDPYKHLIAICPSQRDLDFRFVSVHPIRAIDPIPVTLAVYWFINRVNQLYLNNKVLYINRYLQIS